MLPQSEVYDTNQSVHFVIGFVRFFHEVGKFFSGHSMLLTIDLACVLVGVGSSIEVDDCTQTRI